MAAHLFLAGRRREMEMSELLGVSALAHSEDGDAIKKQIEQWSDQ